jgi:hypothetical protein
MALEKVVKADKVEIVGDYHHIQVRTATIIYDDGEEISSSFHRHVIAPGEDCSGEEEWIQSICAATHTPDIIEAYQAHIAETSIIPSNPDT